jgi:hypothetical protein
VCVSLMVMCFDIEDGNERNEFYSHNFGLERLFSILGLHERWSAPWVVDSFFTLTTLGLHDTFWNFGC